MTSASPDAPEDAVPSRSTSADSPDAATPDAATPDAATPDAATPDAAAPDADSLDADSPDGDSLDAAAEGSVAAVAESARPANARLLASVEVARAAAVEVAGADAVGEFEEVRVEDEHAVSYFFAADQPGYRGWRWAVTLAEGGGDRPVTVSETVLLPGPDALVAPAWVPWQDRVRAGDLGVGDLLPTEPDDPRLVPGYLMSDDPAVEEVAREAGLGRVRVLSRLGRDQAAERWRDGEHGPKAEMAKAAPATCASCGFYLPLAGSLRAAFGVCGNEFAPADGAVVHAEYGCGAHSDVVAEPGPVAPVAELVYDDGVELEPR